MRRSGVAWIAFGTWCGLAAVTMTFAWFNRALTGDLGSLDSVDFVYVVASVVFAFVSAIVGLVVPARTHHPIGWLLLVFAVTIILPIIAEQYAFYGIVTTPGSVPAAGTVAWAAYSSFALILPVLVLILVLFPNGRARSPRWRVLIVATPVVAASWAISTAVQPGQVNDTGWHEQGVVVINEFAIEGVPWLRQLPGIAGALVIGLFVAAVASLVLRFRASKGIERQQIKWLALVAVAAALLIVCIVVASFVAAGSPAQDAVGSIGWGLLVATILLGLPLAIGASVLRYRLYDIDRIISRTLAYFLVTGLLLAAYVGLVILFQRVLPLGASSDLAVAVSTLIVAAAFVPLRRRVQRVVDHRFNRARYDAGRTIETFSARLREEIDLDALGAELETLVTQTMHPTHVSLWLRGSTR